MQAISTHRTDLNIGSIRQISLTNITFTVKNTSRYDNVIKITQILKDLTIYAKAKHQIVYGCVIGINQYRFLLKHGYIGLRYGVINNGSVPGIVAWATAAHSFPRDTACLCVYGCTRSYTWLLYGLLWRMLLYHVTCG